jgi:transposase
MGAVQSSGKLVTLKNGRTRLFRSKLVRRQIVEETMKPGASVALVARAHGVNANQIFNWRKMYEEGRLDTTSPTLLPVKLTDTVPVRSSPGKKPKRIKAGVIDIDLGHARVRIEGAADPDCVRSTLESLIR